MMRPKSNCPEVSEKSNLSAGIAGKWHKKRQGTGHITSSHHLIVIQNQFMVGQLPLAFVDGFGT